MHQYPLEQRCVRFKRATAIGEVAGNVGPVEHVQRESVVGLGIVQFGRLEPVQMISETDPPPAVGPRIAHI